MRAISVFDIFVVEAGSENVLAHDFEDTILESDGLHVQVLDLAARRPSHHFRNHA